MKFPITIAPNFFSDTQKILKIANGLDYVVDEPFYPGKKTIFLNHIDMDLFYHLSRKVLNLFFEIDDDIGKLQYNNVEWAFHKIKYDDIKDMRKGELFIHKDHPEHLTGLIYLSHNENLGTSFYLNEKTPSFHKMNGPICGLDKNISDEEMENLYNENNAGFKLLSEVRHVFNTAVIFPGCVPHKINLEDLKPGGERLTLHFKFCEISYHTFPYVRCKLEDL